MGRGILRTFLFALCVGQAVAVLLFVHGFLLTRIHLKDTSVTENQDYACEKPYKKLVWLVVDALRYDFVVHDSRYPCDDNKKGLEGACAYKYQMPFLSSFVEKPGVSRVFRYIADAPTTTTQRLKSMTSGSLPIFFDISNAFSASAMDEDNLIDQFASAGKRLVFMGDSTWSGLYPTQFNVSHPFPCYNIMDLHTVDDGIGKLLIPTIENESWDVLVAHYLGVDHAGHAHGVESEAMMNKLRQIDSSVKHVVDVLRKGAYPGGPFEDALVLVGGDHGQTLTGDHGGGSPEEVDSVLIAIDVKSYRDDGDASVEKQQCEKDCSCGQDRNQCVEDLMQIDLVPTLAGLMHIPIPFINLGKVSKQLWSLAGPARCGVSSYEQILRANSKQVFQYLTTYASMPGARFPDTDLRRLRKAYNSLNDDEESHTEFLIMTEKLARSAWTQFHDGWMIGGGLLYLAIVIFIGSLLVQIIQNMERRYSKGQIENTVPGRATLVWLANLVHPVGIFSFFFLLNEGWCISYLFASLVLLVMILEIVFRRAHVLHIVKGALMSVVSCFIVSKYGIQTHSGFGFWQQLTQHGSSESHAPDSDEASWMYPEWLPRAKDLTRAIDPHNVSFLIQYAIPTCLLVYISSRKFKECRHVFSQTIFRLFTYIGFTCCAAFHYVLHVKEHNNKGEEEALRVEHLVGSIHPSLSTYVFPSPLIQLPLDIALPNICFGSILIVIMCSIIQRIRGCISFTDASTALCTVLIQLALLISPVATPLIAVGILAQIYGLLTLFRQDDTKLIDWISTCGSLALVQSQSFFVTGHLCEFSGLLYTAAFMGQTDYNLLRSGLLLGFDTCGWMIITILLACILAPQHTADSTKKHISHQKYMTTARPAFSIRYVFIDLPGMIASQISEKSPIQGTLALFGFMRSLVCFCSMISAGIQKRHLYAWALFAPKFVFEVYFLSITYLTLLVMSVFV